MGLNVEDIIAGLDPAERRKVEEMAAELIAEEMTLRELRKARQLTQVSVARVLGINQDAVSRLEQRSDLFMRKAGTSRECTISWNVVPG